LRTDPAPGHAIRGSRWSAADAVRPLLDDWAAERKPAANTLRTYRRTLRLIREAVGVDDARKVDKATVTKFKKGRLAAGLNPGTVADDILAAGAVFNWAVRNGLLPSNPFEGMAPRPTGRGEAPRDGYTDEDAQRILEAARKEAGWRRWLPWLCAFTGCRISEAADLRRRDIRREGGVWIVDFVPTAARAGKNADFQRMVPVHPALSAEGFLAYADGVPADGPLFPDIHADADGARSKSATSAHTRWLRGTVGITDPRKGPSHSWRHRMEDELRKVRALPEVQDAITGRKNQRNAGAGYGKGFRGMPAETLKDLERIPSPLRSA
jgi:integrase